MTILPEYIDKDLWADFIEGRKEMQAKNRIPWTETAKKRLIMKCERLHEQGHDVNQCLEESICNCWRSVFPPKIQHGAPGQPNRQEAQEYRNMQGALDWATGGHDARH